MEQNNITYSPMGQKSEVYLIGTIVDTPKLMYTGNDKVPMCRFRISIGRKDGKRDIFLCTAWHDTAEEIVEKHKFKEHDIAALYGTLRNHRYVQDNDYYHHYYNNHHINNIIISRTDYYNYNIYDNDHNNNNNSNYYQYN